MCVVFFICQLFIVWGVVVFWGKGLGLCVVQCCEYVFWSEWYLLQVCFGSVEDCIGDGCGVGY